MKPGRQIILTFLLAIPLILFLLHYFSAHSAELHPTGFTLDENVLYMSYARQYLDSDSISLFYSNPFDADPEAPRIYFQPINFLFAGLFTIGMQPGLAQCLVGLLAGLFYIYIGISLIQKILPDHKYLNLIATLFIWGGGLTGIAGLIGSIVLPGHSYDSFLDGIHLVDPANGWWGMNMGRTLFIAAEAFYHLLFLLGIYLLIKRKWLFAFLISFLLSLSHPFTGIEYLLIVMVWLISEKIFFKNKSIPLSFIAGIALILFFHIWYYLIYLNKFPQHRTIFDQYSVDWGYSFFVIIPAYCLVAGVSAIALFKINPVKKLIEAPHQRLFLLWAVIAFLLSKHEWFIKPMQPIHFTRGYVWAGLFLFGLPGLLWLINYLRKWEKGKLIGALFVLLFLSDNLLWTINILRKRDKYEWEGHIANATKEVLSFLEKKTTEKSLILGNSSLVNYLSNVYTSANTWVSHPYNTPNRAERIHQMDEYLKTGNTPADWKNRELFIVIDKRRDLELLNPSLQKNKVFENEVYAVYIP